MAVKSYALTTRQRLKDYIDLNTTDDDTLLDRIIDAATEWIENYCGRRFKQTAHSNKEIDSDGSNFLFLPNYPVNSGATFTLQERDTLENSDDWSTIDSKDYWVDYDTGIINRIGRANWQVGHRMYRVTYTAGYNYDNAATFLTDTEAGELELAMWKLCSALYSDRRGDSRVKSEKIGSYSVTFAKIALEDDPTIGAMLSNYRKRDAEIGGGIGPYLY